MKLEKGMINLDPFDYLMYYHDIEIMEEFEIKNMADSPYHFNSAKSLCNNENEIRNELLYVILESPNRVKKIIPTKQIILDLTETEEEAVKKFLGIGWLGVRLRNE